MKTAEIKKSEKGAALYKALYERGFYNPHNVFHNAPDIEFEPENSKYDFKVQIYKWNTSSNCLIILGARWEEKQQRYILSTYKMGSVPRMKHGEKMR